MLPAIETLRSVYPLKNHIQDYLLTTILRADAYTGDIPIAGHHVAIFGPGAGAEIAYFTNRGARVTAVDDHRYAFVDQFRPINRLYKGATEEKRSIQDWITEASRDTYRLIVAFNMDKDVIPDLNQAANEHGQSSFAHQLSKILTPGGVFVMTGDLLPDPNTMLPLETKYVWPDYDRLKRELSHDPIALAKISNIHFTDNDHCLWATKPQ